MFPQGKEAHFWSRISDGVIDGGKWLSKLQPRMRQTVDGCPTFTGEITPAYALLPRERIAGIQALCPRIRLFIVLRNPIERAWSAALMALTRCGMEEHEASDQWFIDHFRSLQSRQRGDYLSCIRPWQSVFAAQQLLILFTDDIAERPRTVLQLLASHLAIETSRYDRLTDAQIQERVVPNLGVGFADHRRLPLSPSLFGELHVTYGSAIDKLAVALRCYLSPWNRPKPPDSTVGSLFFETVAVKPSAEPSRLQGNDIIPAAASAPSWKALDV